jgi:hypothetical protein
MNQGMHEQRNYPPPRGITVIGQAANQHHATQGQARDQDPILHNGQAAQHIPTNCQLSLGCACIRGSGLPERTVRHDKRIEPCCTQS